MATLVCGGQVLLWEKAAWHLEYLDLWLEQGYITHLLSPDAPRPDSADSIDPGEVTIIDAQGELILPGLINAHYHSHDNLVRGMGPQAPLELWSLVPTPFRQDYTPREAYVSALLGCAELLASGCTGLIDHVKLSPHLDSEGLSAVVEAYRTAGLRAIVAPVVSDRPFEQTLPLNAQEQATCGGVSGWATLPATEQIARVETLIRDEDDGPTGRLRIGIGPSGPQRCTDELLVQAAELADRYQTPLHMHVLESRMQQVMVKKRYGQAVTAHLAELGALGPRTHLVHMVWPEDEDLEYVAASGAIIVHNPISNVYLGSGIAPIPKMRALNIPVALGSDSACCNHSHNMFENIKWAGLIHNLASPDPGQWLNPDAALALATIGGAQALGLGDSGGQIALGQVADLILLDADSPGLIPLNAPTQQLAYAAEHGLVTKVIVGGELVYDQYPLKFDIEALYQEARAIAGSRLARYGYKSSNSKVHTAVETAYRRHVGL